SMFPAIAKSLGTRGRQSSTARSASSGVPRFVRSPPTSSTSTSPIASSTLGTASKRSCTSTTYAIRIDASVPRGVRRHEREHAEGATLPPQDLAPEVDRALREHVVGQRGLDDPRALVELGVELLRSPARVSGEHPSPAQLPERVRVDLGGEE